MTVTEISYVLATPKTKQKKKPKGAYLKGDKK
jgi:hypothetical protein